MISVHNTTDLNVIGTHGNTTIGITDDLIYCGSIGNDNRCGLLGQDSLCRSQTSRSNISNGKRIGSITQVGEVIIGQ